jgi:hypothetical protein
MDDHDVIRSAMARLLGGEASPAQLLGVAPRIVEGLYALGLDAQTRGQTSLADNLFQRCLLLDPFRADFWLAIAASRQSLGRAAEAGEMYQVAGLVSGELAPVAYAAASFAAAGQGARARSLAAYVRQSGAPGVEPWLVFAEGAVSDASTGAP